MIVGKLNLDDTWLLQEWTHLWQHYSSGWTCEIPIPWTENNITTVGFGILLISFCFIKKKLEGGVYIYLFILVNIFLGIKGET